MEKKLVLIDGHSILNRAFYGVPDLTNKEGFHTNAIYGFLNILFKILEEEKAEYLAVAFDVKAPTFRHEIYKEYKGTRKPMPEELREQVPVMKEILKAMNVLVLEKAGLEADDILGTLAKLGEKEGCQVSLVSGDRDLLQIASEHIKIRIPKTKGARTEVEDYYAKDVLEKYQVTPEQFIELKALMGDTADNIPGVPKIGEKTATGLLVEYGTIDNIYAHLEDISKKSIRETLAANRELADLSKTLATIDIQAKVPFSLEAAKIGRLYTKEAYELFSKLEFKNMLSRFEEDTTHNDHADSFFYVEERTKADSIFETAASKEYAAYSFFSEWVKEETKETPLERMIRGEDGEAEGRKLLGIAFSYGEDNHVFFKAGEELTEEYLLSQMSELANAYRRQKKLLIAFDVKKTYEYFSLSQIDRRLTDGFFDVKLAAYLLNPLKSEYTIEDIANEQLGIMLKDRAAYFGKKSLYESMKNEKEAFLEYACFHSYTAYASYEKLKRQLADADMEQLMQDMEMPLTYVLYQMEKEGVMVKAGELKEYGQVLSVRIDQLEKEIYEGVGEEFNINSPKQLGEILFGKLGYKGGKKTKTGYSTAADVLEKLAPDYPVVSKILEYRGLAKLKSTYAEGLYDYIREDGRIHSNFNQMITATGRISSTEPNLQNIPMRMELGRLIRKVFVPKEGCVLMDADYSQIELRILAHMSGDEALIEAYNQSEDIHRITASKVFHTPFEEVTDLQRRNAKAVNFGIVYGISSFGLSQDLSISKKEAADYIEAYFNTYPGVKAFLDAEVEKAKKQGYSITLYNRRRPLPEIKSSNFMQRQFGERVAMNAPIQGTAADIMKLAMIAVYWALFEAGLSSKLILQVHDELLIETKLEEKAQVEEILAGSMKHAAQLKVELEVDLHTGENWYEAK
ncbi:MAG: DNA polymerase I [Roseburia sp.]|nr:DNA polymerase I [Roseburia sp.]MCM1279193.1 DNA polymerase I [Robinsoniella sp.]